MPAVGILKGNIFGPLLFLIYVIDLPSSLHDCDLTVNADNTVIHASAMDDSTLSPRLISI